MNISNSLDASDFRLLDLLQVQADLSNQALAAAAHMAPATCHRRVQRLRSLGLIDRQVALLARERVNALIGPRLEAIIEVSLDEQSQGKLRAFEQRAIACSEVAQCWRVSAGPDFILVVQAVDMDAYNAFTQQLFSSDLNVRNVRAFFCTHVSKFSTALTLPKHPQDKR